MTEGCGAAAGEHCRYKTAQIFVRIVIYFFIKIILKGRKVSMRKKLVSTLLSAAMVAALLIGCGSGAQTDAPAADAGQTETADTAAADTADTAAADTADAAAPAGNTGEGKT